jgi:hypothetical protein
MVEWSYSSRHFKLRNLVKVNGRLLALSGNPEESDSSRLHIGQKAESYLEPVRLQRRRKTSLHVPGIDLRSSSL